MARQTSEPISMTKEEARTLFADCLKKRGMSPDDFTAAVGMRFPRRGHQPAPQSVMTYYNAFTPSSGPFTLDRAAKWCAVLEYPLEDFLAGKPYVDPLSQEGLARKLDKAIERITKLEEEVRTLKEINGQVTT